MHNDDGNEFEEDSVVETEPSGRYVRFEHVLGAGAFKTVYRAMDTELGIEVAWNQVLIDRVQLDKTKVLREIQFFQKIRHANIIEFYHFWIDEARNQVVFITELMPSGTLTNYIQKSPEVKLKIIKIWCKQILFGLNYLHTQNPPIIHRDIKCDNIFINGTTEGEVKIGDLGLATFCLKKDALSVIGTPEFMAPEFYNEVYSTSVDIWAFGMAMIEMVTRVCPYAECDNVGQIFKKVSGGVRPIQLTWILDTEVRDFIQLCLADEHDRPTAEQLLQHPFFTIEGENANFPVPVAHPESTTDSNGNNNNTVTNGYNNNANNTNGYSNTTTNNNNNNNNNNMNNINTNNNNNNQSTQDDRFDSSFDGNNNNNNMNGHNNSNNGINNNNMNNGFNSQSSPSSPQELRREIDTTYTHTTNGRHPLESLQHNYSHPTLSYHNHNGHMSSNGHHPFNISSSLNNIVYSNGTSSMMNHSLNSSNLPVKTSTDSALSTITNAINNNNNNDTTVQPTLYQQKPQQQQDNASSLPIPDLSDATASAPATVGGGLAVINENSMSPQTPPASPVPARRAMSGHVVSDPQVIVVNTDAGSDCCIAMKLLLVISGETSAIEFTYNFKQDTAASVAKEMVREFDLQLDALQDICNLIQEQVDMVVGTLLRSSSNSQGDDLDSLTGTPDVNTHPSNNNNNNNNSNNSSTNSGTLSNTSTRVNSPQQPSSPTQHATSNSTSIPGFALNELVSQSEPHLFAYSPSSSIIDLSVEPAHPPLTSYSDGEYQSTQFGYRDSDTVTNLEFLADDLESSDISFSLPPSTMHDMTDLEDLLDGDDYDLLAQNNSLIDGEYLLDDLTDFPFRRNSAEGLNPLLVSDNDDVDTVSSFSDSDYEDEEEYIALKKKHEKELHDLIRAQENELKEFCAMQRQRRIRASFKSDEKSTRFTQKTKETSLSPVPNGYLSQSTSPVNGFLSRLHHQHHLFSSSSDHHHTSSGFYDLAPIRNRNLRKSSS